MLRLNRSIAVLVLGTALALAGPAFAEPKDDVAAAAKEWASAFDAHDVNRIVSLYSKDALLWGTTSPSLRTTPAEVREFFEGVFKIPNVKITIENQTIRLHGDVAVVAGNYTFVASQGDQRQLRPARYSFTLVKQGDKWLIVDHNSSPMPPGTRT